MEDVLWHISYANFVMDLASIPSLEGETEDDEAKAEGETVDSMEELMARLNMMG